MFYECSTNDYLSEKIGPAGEWFRPSNSCRPAPRQTGVCATALLRYVPEALRALLCICKAFHKSELLSLLSGR